MLAAVGRAGGEPEPERPGVVGVVAERPHGASRRRPSWSVSGSWPTPCRPGREAARAEPRLIARPRRARAKARAAAHHRLGAPQRERRRRAASTTSRRLVVGTPARALGMPHEVASGACARARGQTSPHALRHAACSEGARQTRQPSRCRGARVRPAPSPRGRFLAEQPGAAVAASPHFFGQRPGPSACRTSARATSSEPTIIKEVICARNTR